MKKRIVPILLSFCLLLSGCSDIYSKLNLHNEPLDEKDIYEQLEKTFEDYEESVTFYNTEYDTIAEIYDDVIADHPEYFWVCDGYSYYEDDFAGLEYVTIEPLYSGEESDTVNKKRNELKNIVDDIVDKAKTKSDQYEQAIFVHDYIINNTEYDSETAEIIDLEENKDVIFESSTAYGCLINNKAICTGYSAAFQLLMEELEFECFRVCGQADGELHEWNCLKLGEEYYYVDITWDDPVLTEENDIREGKLSYEYFCITSEELFATHTLEDGEEVPECTGKQYDYYIYNGMYADVYDYNSASAIISGQLSSGIAEIKFSSTYELNRALDDLITKNKIFYVSGINDELSYTTGTSERILIIRN